MKKTVLVLCLAIGAALGAIAGSDRTRSDRAWGEVSNAADDLQRSSELRDQVEHLRTRFEAVQRDLAAASTPDAATAARVELFQLRVDMVAVQDEIQSLSRRRRVAR